MEFAHLGVQILIFVGLIWYACETRKIRRTSQKQVETSQRQNKISQEQNEAMHKPCLVPLVQKRDDQDTGIESMRPNSHPGYRVVVNGPSGRVELKNIGCGPAFNIRYELQSPNGVRTNYSGGYLPYLHEDAEPIWPIANTLLPANTGKVVLKLSYESLSGIRYESALHIRESRNGPVVTCYEFRYCSRQCSLQGS